MRQFLSYILLLTAFMACIDRVELPIRAESPRLVVEGQITNEAPPYTIRLTYTGNYTSGGQNPADQYVREAQVSLADDQGRSTRFVMMGSGLYQTIDSTFRGQVGRSYSLTVVLNDGKRYVTKPEQMPAVPVIDSISSQLVKTNNVVKPYAVSYGVNTIDPANEKNYYRWTGYGYTNRLSLGVPCSLGSPNKCYTRCWTTESTNVVNIYSDEAINGNSIRNRFVLRIPVYTLGPQLVEIQQYGMTQANYQFWKLYQQQNARTGSIFDPLPAPVTGNVVNANDPSDVARGYFAVTSITRKRLRMMNYSAPFYPAVNSYIASQILPDGDCRNTYGPVPITEPDGWQ
ncbi:MULTISPECIES: DUF4249 domain-containing protein [unclassified Spirosoma]|uniref:DUF4249 domain-containing protein n=1 Tax=unclassified Spirosoma TaxID=2621999 RepID=UPI00095B05EF|nr:MULTISPECIES: DUF4249 domain-containing protein [unclassified Spirosoma]MBN8826281.1 DUF4249 domain-containing protein [Spirosoma sp.]OJW75181.1 MAG: hypothetical protein BGO59_17970 [Spirosoma sp. 48-14]